MAEGGAVTLTAGEASATVALRGAEPLSWRIGGRDLLWSGDPDHWGYRAPILFPVVGASKDGAVRVDGRSYPMPQHGFARTATFALMEADACSARLRLQDSQETRAHYPFAFTLDVMVALAEAALSLDFAVTNAGETPMPYGLGFHPAFPWPLDGTGREGHRVVFEQDEKAVCPEVGNGGLLAHQTRIVPMAGPILPLSPDLFSEALVFLDARSRSMRFEAPSGAAITLAGEGFRHLAIWSRPTAPFLSLEAWSAHADWENATGDLETRPSMITLAPGETGRHRTTLSWQPAGMGG